VKHMLPPKGGSSCARAGKALFFMILNHIALLLTGIMTHADGKNKSMTQEDGRSMLNADAKAKAYRGAGPFPIIISLSSKIKNDRIGSMPSSITFLIFNYHKNP